jgi:hypothetical protein
MTIPCWSRQANVCSTVLKQSTYGENVTAFTNMNKNKFSFGHGDENLVVLKDGEAFFVSQIANKCMGSLCIGLQLPPVACTVKDDGVCSGYRGPYWGNSQTEIFVGGGSCCDGYLMGVSPEGKITKILAIDFNIRCIQPIIWMETKGSPTVPEEVAMLGLLVSGAGCSGYGVRFVDFNRVTPVSMTVVGTEEAIKRSDFWRNGGDPFSVADIWDRLAKLGIKADKERTAMASKAFVAF